MFQVCKICGEDDQSKIAFNGKKGKRNMCKSCKSEHTKDGYRRLKREVFDALGNKCVVCGEHRIEFLTLDHVNNDGNEHRRSLTGNSRAGNSPMVYRDVRKQGYPKDKFQLLCYNCNNVKQTHKYNPIIIEREQNALAEGYMGEGI